MQHGICKSRSPVDLKTVPVPWLWDTLRPQSFDRRTIDESVYHKLSPLIRLTYAVRF
ncbi:hypothetical protein BCL67_1323 [Nesterenkonia sandarakina]|uniref:Uncharacterized protein n=1 Tax=Nesterenkonia sandarakina TaxID=272918 RepID=A0A2T0YAQ8_9MICC|nr:hypothetical protein BCL67_1323 [Nesterenkonia sandarakina]